MNYILIKGTYHIVGQSPDADSVKFRASNPALWQQIDTENRAIFERRIAEDNGVIQLRLQGIDALETHYSPPALPAPEDVKGKTLANVVEPKTGGYKQLTAMGLRSTAELLKMLGVTDAKWRTFGTSTYISEANVSAGTTTGLIKTKLGDSIPGYIVCNDVELNGRPLAWVFTGTTTLADGASLTVQQLADMIEQSANYRLLRQGMVYPLFFMTLSAKLRNKLIAATYLAQDAAKRLGDAAGLPPEKISSIWQIDGSVAGMAIGSLRVLTDEKALYPYLFRKVIRLNYRTQMELYWESLRTLRVPENVSQGVDLSGFFRDANPYVFVISDQDFVRLDEVVQIVGNQLKMTKLPQDLVLMSS